MECVVQWPTCKQGCHHRLPRECCTPFAINSFISQGCTLDILARLPLPAQAFDESPDYKFSSRHTKVYIRMLQLDLDIQVYIQDRSFHLAALAILID